MASRAGGQTSEARDPRRGRRTSQPVSPSPDDADDAGRDARGPSGWALSSDGTVRLRLAGGGVLEVATCPRLDIDSGLGPRRAFLSPETGRRGPFVAIVEGVPAAIADLFYSHARDELERVSAVPGTSLNRAVRAGCGAVRSAARRRPDLDAFGFTAVLFESTPDPVAFVAQLPPCQLYLVDGADVRPFPEVPTGRASGRGRSVSERRWEIEIESVRVPLVHDARLVLVDASTPEALPDPARLVELARRHVGQMAGRLDGLLRGREAVVIRFARPSASATGIARASSLVRDLVRGISTPTKAAARLFGSGEPEGGAGDRWQTDQSGTAEDPVRREALLELEATGRIPAPYTRVGSSGVSRADELTTRERSGVPLRTGPNPAPPRRSPGSNAAPDAARSAAPASVESLGERQSSPGVRRRATAPGALVGQTVPADAPWLAPARGSLVPTTFSGTPLDSARYPRATDPRGWLSRMLGPTVFLPGSRRRSRPLWVSVVAFVAVTAAAVGTVWAAFQPNVIDLVAARIAPPTPTVTPAPPTPTIPVLSGKTVAQARGRFTSLAAPPNLVGESNAGAGSGGRLIAVLDDVGDVVTIAMGSLETTRLPATPPAAARPAPGFVARGLFASGGALVPRDDGTILFDASGSIVLLPSGGQPMRPLKVKSQGVWGFPVAAVVYGAAMYVFDVGSPVAGQPSAGVVWRHPLTAGGNYDADAVAWLASGQRVDLTLASDVATDGAFWVSRRDGTIVRLAAGKAEVLTLTGGALPTRLGAIYTDQGTDALYVVDEPSRRLVRIGKDGVIGGYVDAVLSPGEAARGLWVDAEAKMAVVVTTARVALVPLPG